MSFDPSTDEEAVVTPATDDVSVAPATDEGAAEDVEATDEVAETDEEVAE